MSGNPRNSRRRRLLGAVAAAGAAGLPQRWSRPVVDHVLLPVHARTSGLGVRTVTTNCDLTCTSGSIVQARQDTSAPSGFAEATYSSFVFTDCISTPGGDVSRASVFSASATSYVATFTTTEASSAAASFTSGGLCDVTTA